MLRLLFPYFMVTVFTLGLGYGLTSLDENSKKNRHLLVLITLVVALFLAHEFVVSPHYESGGSGLHSGAAYAGDGIMLLEELLLVMVVLTCLWLGTMLDVLCNVLMTVIEPRVNERESLRRMLALSAQGRSNIALMLMEGKKYTSTEALLLQAQLLRNCGRDQDALDLCRQMMVQHPQGHQPIETMIAQLGGSPPIPVITPTAEPTAIPAASPVPASTPAKETPPKEPGLPPSKNPEIAALIKAKRLGSAIELLEEGLRQHPDDFEGWMALADVQINHCDQSQSAEQVVKRIQWSRTFSQEQKSLATESLQKWQTAHFRRLHH